MSEYASDFKIGDCVRLTPEGIKALSGGAPNDRYNDSTRGTVVGFGKASPFMVRILRDGLKTADTVHCRFWEPLNER